MDKKPNANKKRAISANSINLADVVGLEPTVIALEEQCFIHLSYTSKN